jgi:uncharacterized membrane protein
MSTIAEQIEALKKQISDLQLRHKLFEREYDVIWKSIYELEALEFNNKAEETLNAQQQIEEPVIPVQKEEIIEKENIEEENVESSKTAMHYGSTEKIITPHYQTNQAKSYRVEDKTNTSNIQKDLEKFIGENIISKIGIIITILGVTIGAKYSIEHQLISPLTRIIIGYFLGTGLLVFGIYLKKKYENFSAVLVSGAIAINYFLTYAAFSFYHLIPKEFAFLLMFVLTVFTVVASVKYNQQIIAHIGFVGAYAVPFLLSDGKGEVLYLFVYMTIINSGILALAYKKYWKSLYFSSYAFTWLTFIVWLINGYNSEQNFGLALTFLSVFFLMFYGISILYKLVRKEQFGSSDVWMILSNSFLFFGLGYFILSSNPITNENFLGLFALLNAIIHVTFALYVHKKQLVDQNLFYLILALVFTFLTISIPIQLDGHWVTLLWLVEGLALFWIGRVKEIKIYEQISYPITILACLSVIEDWKMGYSLYFNDSAVQTSFLNPYFMTSCIAILCFYLFTKIHTKYKINSTYSSVTDIQNALTYLYPFLFLAFCYNSIFLEIIAYWDLKWIHSVTLVKQIGSKFSIYNPDLKLFKDVWLMNYSLFFVILLNVLNWLKIKQKNLGYLLTFLSYAILFLFLTVGLYSLGELVFSYIFEKQTVYFPNSFYKVWVRYISYGFVATLLFAMYKNLKNNLVEIKDVHLFKVFEIGLATTILWLISSELVIWMDMTHFSSSFKLVLSILWGVYALILISIGIAKNKQNLRIGAMVLFAFTLLKLFFYDIAHLDTISKTIVFVSLGILLLIISFLYNKFKHLISNNEE